MLQTDRFRIVVPYDDPHPTGIGASMGNSPRRERTKGPYGFAAGVARSAANYLARSPHWAHLMRSTLELGWKDIH
jgi:hypothetical protein